MKLPFLLCVLGILGFSLTSSETERAGGSIQDEFAVSIREQTAATTAVESETITGTETTNAEGL